MINYEHTINKILEKSGALKAIDQSEIDDIKTAIKLDLNKYLMDAILASLETDDIKRIESILNSDDQAGLDNILNELKNNKEIEKSLNKAVKDYENNMIGDLKTIKKIHTKSKRK